MVALLLKYRITCASVLIAAIIYPNLRGIQVTMPHNVINLGGKTDKLPTNLDVLSSFATIGVMEGLERKALGNKAGGN